MTVTLEGTITQIYDIEQKKDFKFQRVRMQIDQNSEYPQTVEFQATEKTFAAVDQFAAGDVVKATCNLRGNVWAEKDMCFMSFSLWKLEKDDSAPQTSAPQYQAPENGNDDGSDLPF